MRAIVLVALVLCRADLSGPPQLPYARQALDVGRTNDDALLEAFHRGYELTPGDTIDRVEIVTEFRRAVMIVRDRANLGNHSMTMVDLAKAMQPFEGLVTFIVEARLHPLHTYPGAPLFDLYVETGPATKPLGAKPLKRAPVYPPGLAPGTSMSAVRLEGAFLRAEIEAAPSPVLVVTDDQANIIWKARIDLSRYR
jgi:hypothetical protein